MNKDYKDDYSLIGSIFLDYKNKKDFNDNYILLYGHSMDGDKMFGKLPSLLNKEVFDKYTKGSIYYNNQMHNIDIFAVVYTNAYDKVFYNSQFITNIIQRDEIISYIKQNAKHFRNVMIEDDDKIIGMSTCSSLTTDGRVMVFGIIR